MSKIDGARVLVDAIKTALRNQPPRMEMFVLVRWDGRPRFRPPRPRLYEPLAECATCLDEEGSRAHGRIAELEVEYGLGPCGGPEPVERQLQRVLHNWSRQRARGVVAGGAPALVGRLQERCAWRCDMAARRGTLVHDWTEGRDDPRLIRR